MREVILTKNGAIKISNGDFDLFKTDIELNFTPVPNENVILKNVKSNEIYTGFLISDDSARSAVVLCRYYKKFNLVEYINKKIVKAFNKKSQLYKDNFRLIHGGADGLPSMVIDCYSEVIFIQLKDCFYDPFREELKEQLFKLFSKKIFFLEDKEYRLKKSQPIFEQEKLPENVLIEENNISYKLDINTLQKNGYYFDHRINRRVGADVAEQFFDDKDVKCLDLFSYIGSWGLNLLSRRFENVTFVDQGDFVDTINHNVQINKYINTGKVVREDVFKFLDKAIASNAKYDVICCDPPAFCKSHSKKKNAIEGYRKLINKLFKISSQKTIINFGSCTQYVNIEELMEIFKKEARKNESEISLCAVGTQGFDHTNYGFNDKSNYIKFISYYTERNDEQSVEK